MPDKKKPHEIVEVYKNVPVPCHPMLRIRVPIPLFKKIIDIAVETGLSERQILAYSSRPCERCKGTFVVVQTESGEVLVERGLLSHHVHEGSGVFPRRKNKKDAKGD